MRKYVYLPLPVFVCVLCAQTKVFKLVVRIGENHEGTTTGREPRRMDRAVEGPAASAVAVERRDKIVRVCSWLDRRAEGPSSSEVGVVEPVAATAAQHVHMPSVKELAKQFSSDVVSPMFFTRRRNLMNIFFLW